MSIINFIASLFISASISTSQVPVDTVTSTQSITTTTKSAKVAVVPFYSQFSDISSPYWKKRGCGVASLAMFIDFYNNKNISVDNLLNKGINSGAYIKGAGWSHQGLVNLSKEHGLTGQTYDLSLLTNKKAFKKFEEIIKNGPVIVSTHYKFEPGNPIPHLAVINSTNEDYIYYNDPASTKANEKITKERFMNAWKQRFIVIRPS